MAYEKQKPAFNYDMEECNRLIKMGVMPIGCGVHNTTKNAYMVFRGTYEYFNSIRMIRKED